MRARRMRRDVKPLAVAAETVRVVPGPRDRAAHLLVHRHQIAAGLLDIDEIGDDAMRAGAYQRLGERVIIRAFVAAPRAAVEENVDRRVRHLRGKNIELFIFARTVSNTLRLTEDRPRPLGRSDPARDDEGPVGRIDILVVGVVERLLVEVAPDRWTIDLRALGIRGHYVPFPSSRSPNAVCSSAKPATAEATDLHQIVRTVFCELLRRHNAAPQLARQFFQARGQIDRRTDAREIEPVAAADIAVKNVADVERESEVDIEVLAGRGMQRLDIAARGMGGLQRGGANHRGVRSRRRSEKWPAARRP